jgi:SAM-dependent methyltransferase
VSAPAQSLGTRDPLSAYWCTLRCSKCAACGSDAAHKILSLAACDRIPNPYERGAIEDLGGLPPGGVSYMRCPRHGLVYMSPTLTREGQVRFFDSFYRRSRGTSDESWQARLGARRLRQISRFVRPPGRLLDIGCGNGEFAQSAAGAGWEAWGSEISSTASEAARRRLGDNLVFRNLSEVPSGWAACVTLFSVLEHNTDPGALLGEAARICRPGGWVVFNVPNAGSLEAAVSRALGTDWLGFDVSHSWYWTRKSAGELARGAGLAPRSIESRLPLYSRRSGRKKGVSAAAGGGEASPAPSRDRAAGRDGFAKLQHLSKLADPDFRRGLRILLNTPFDATFLGRWLCLGSYLFVYAQRGWA